MYLIVLGESQERALRPRSGGRQMRVLTIMLVIWLAPAVLLLLAALWVLRRERLSPPDRDTRGLQQDPIKEAEHPSKDQGAA